MAIIDVELSQEGLPQVLAAAKAVALQDVLDPDIKALDHAVRLRVRRWGQAMLDTDIGAEPIEFVLFGGRALAQTAQPVGEVLAVNGQSRVVLIVAMPSKSRKNLRAMPPGSSASSLLAYAEISGHPHTLPNFAQHRPYHAQGKIEKVFVIIWN